MFVNRERMRYFVSLVLIFALLPATNLFAAVQIRLDSYATGVDVGNVTLATLDITQNGANVDFKLTNTVGNLGGNVSSLFISQFGLTYAGGTLAESQFTNFGGQPYVKLEPGGVNTSPKPINIPGSFNFVIEFAYETSNGNGADRFTDTEMMTWTISGVQESDFTSPLVSGTGGLQTLVAIHVQGLPNGGSTTYIDTPPSPTPGTAPHMPEPASAFVWFALVGTLGMRRARS